LSQEESETYFRSRPYGSRIAAWVSEQSSVIPDRAALEIRRREMEAKFPGKDVPLPPFWGGFRVKPERIEFWQGRPNRLHDRFCYRRSNDANWQIDRLAP
jgi:pyridoxamine 5'-phosphate oxidase